MSYRTSRHELAITQPYAGSMPTHVRMGPFTFDVRAGELRDGACNTVLQNQPLQVLLMLLEQPGEVVSRREIQQRLWPEGVIVNFEVSISQAVRKLRFALHDSATQPRYVETVGRRGYRLKVPVIPDVPTCTDAGYCEPALDCAFGGRGNPFGIDAMDERKVLAEVLRQLLEMLAYVGRSLQQGSVGEVHPPSLVTRPIAKAPSRVLSIPGSPYRTG